MGKIGMKVKITSSAEKIFNMDVSGIPLQKRMKHGEKKYKESICKGYQYFTRVNNFFYGCNVVEGGEVARWWATGEPQTDFFVLEGKLHA